MDNSVNKNIYKTDTRDFEFLIWQQFTQAQEIFKHEAYASCTQKNVSDILQRAKKFAYEVLGPTYAEADRESCHLENGEVQLPKSYPFMWQKFKEEWGDMASIDANGSDSALPPFVMQMILEMFMGAHPSFMTYGGFCLPSSTLINKYGTELQKTLFSQKLAQSEWASCLCLTEPQAGSDVSLVSTRATKQEDDTYLLSGEKYLISAGMHDLADNTLYFVMGRGEKSGSGTFGLSCFIVPKYWVNEDGDRKSVV